MAITYIDAARSGAAKSSIDLPLAAVAALAVGFVAFVMPSDLLGRVVETSGLPSLLAAAQPPLGATARASVGAAAALATFAAVFLLLRALGRGASTAEPREAEPEMPKLRRSAFHPDAPARRPILAGRDLGEPTADPEPSPPPFWHPDDFPAEPEADRFEAAEGDPDELELGGPGTEMMTAAADAPLPDSAARLESLEELAPGDENSITDLMARLERGLTRRLRDKGVYPKPETAAPTAFDSEGGDRLRSAIENLQKIAARAR